MDSICAWEIDSIWRKLYKSKEIDLSIIYLYWRSRVFGKDSTNLKKIMFWDRYEKRHGDLKCIIFYFYFFLIVVVFVRFRKRSKSVLLFFIIYV